MVIETVSETRSHGSTQGVYKHASVATGTDMTFSLFVPDRPGPIPLLWYLSGLSCTHANVTEKGEYRAACAEQGLAFLAPDTSPRGDGVPDDPDGAWDFGLGAGFYVDATEEPWSANYRMWSYVTDELPALVAGHFPLDMLLDCKLAGIAVVDGVSFMERELEKVEIDLVRPSWLVFSDGFKFSVVAALVSRLVNN